MSRTWLIFPLLVLYLTSLGGVGFLGPDEPRYASIGREMAHSWDWITPHLDGQPWFEKSPLLYWMTAAGHILRLPDEWAARLPVALLSLWFLIFFYETIEREFSDRVALAATGILATSAGWLAYSFVSLTDLPMSATLASATMIAMFDTRPNRGWSAGILLGISVLAKGLVPLVLFGPLFLIARRQRLAISLGALAVAAPWYLICYWKNGSLFWNEFFWKHHVQRFLSPALEHPQPFWFYLPVLLALLFPWTPLVLLLGRRAMYNDLRLRLLAGYVLYALVFFSVSINKLPGYVLPLMPGCAVLLAVALDGVDRSGLREDDVLGRNQSWWLAACTLLLVAIPTVANGLPAALLGGIRTVDFRLGLALPFVLAAGVVFFLAWTGRSSAAMLTAALAMIVAAGYVKMRTFPVLDTQVSVRVFSQAYADELKSACIGQTRRTWVYGLNYYANNPLRACVGGEVLVVEGQERLEMKRSR